jgi:hypothetical protein
MNILFHDKKENKLILVEDADEWLVTLVQEVYDVSDEGTLDRFICAMDDEGYEIGSVIIDDTTTIVSI